MDSFVRPVKVKLNGFIHFRVRVVDNGYDMTPDWSCHDMDRAILKAKEIGSLRGLPVVSENDVVILG